MFNENFLHYLWKFKRFNTQNLKTTSGESITIIKTGQHNTDAGPDFFNVQLKINDTLWIGNVEIHLRSSDWNAHKHQTDKAYNNVILHVVYEYNLPIKNENGNEIPTLALLGRVANELIENYQTLIKSKHWVACQNQLKLINDFTLKNWLDRLLLERLERKTIAITAQLNQNKNNIEETFYQALFKYMGLNVNAIPFEQLAFNTPLKIIEKHPQLISVEALLFGQAGFLEEDMNDAYFLRLKKEYQFLASKFNLTPQDKKNWKFARLRPPNFPTLRIAQLAALLKNEGRLFALVLEKKSAKEIKKLFKAEASVYWKTHYQFGVAAKESDKKVGEVLLNALIINVISLFLFVYGKMQQNEKYTDFALQLLKETSVEVNHITKKWNEFGITSTNAAESQALIELKTNYCSEKKCLSCAIGNQLLGK